MAALKLKPEDFHGLFGINSAPPQKRASSTKTTPAMTTSSTFSAMARKDIAKTCWQKSSLHAFVRACTFDIKEMELRVVKSLLQSERRCKILLYGLPGTGKTAFANSLAKELGKPVFSDKKNLNSKSNRMRFLLPCRVAEQQNGIALFDEVDSYLEANVGPFKKSNCDKGEINEILDKSEDKSIWITNSIDGMDESTRRRFTYSVGSKTSRSA